MALTWSVRRTISTSFRPIRLSGDSMMQFEDLGFCARAGPISCASMIYDRWPRSRITPRAAICRVGQAGAGGAYLAFLSSVVSKCRLTRVLGLITT